MNLRRSKVQIIYEHFKKEIVTGKYPPGTLLPVEVEIAKEFSSSRPTVAQAFSRLQQEKLIERKAGYGTYVCDHQSLNKSQEKEYVFGLLIPALGRTEIFEPICAEISNLAKDFSFTLLLGGVVPDDICRSAREMASHYIEQNVDGVFFAPLERIENAVEINKEILDQLSSRGITIILLDRGARPCFSREDADLVGMDNFCAGYDLGQHLIECGCRSIAFLSAEYVAETVEARIIGVQNALKQSSCCNSTLNIIFEHSVPEKTAIEISHIKDLDALVCYNDAAAAVLMPELIKQGIEIPAKLKVAGFDDIAFASHLRVPLTTIAQPCASIAYSAVRLMIDRINMPLIAPRSLFIKSKLIVRESTAG